MSELCNVAGWREFDDRKVREMSESHVTTKAAYVLFYRRRQRCAAVSVSPGGVSTQQSTVDTATPTVVEPVCSRQTTEPAGTAVFSETDWQTDMDTID